jgi:hypothetical protein
VLSKNTCINDVGYGVLFARPATRKADNEVAESESVEAGVSPAKFFKCSGHLPRAELHRKSDSRGVGARISMHSAREAHALLSELPVRIGDPVKLKHRLTENLSVPPQIPGSISGDSAGASAAMRLVARQRKTASVETRTSAIQMRRKVMKCWRVNVS